MVIDPSHPPLLSHISETPISIQPYHSYMFFSDLIKTFDQSYKKKEEKKDKTPQALQADKL